MAAPSAATPADADRATRPGIGGSGQTEPSGEAGARGSSCPETHDECPPRPERVYTWLLVAYSSEFRRACGAEAARTFSQIHAEVAALGRLAASLLWMRTILCVLRDRRPIASKAGARRGARPRSAVCRKSPLEGSHPWTSCARILCLRSGSCGESVPTHWLSSSRLASQLPPTWRSSPSSDRCCCAHSPIRTRSPGVCLRLVSRRRHRTRADICAELLRPASAAGRV